MATPIIVGNWKMHGLTSEANEIVSELLNYSNNHEIQIKTVLCPPFTQIAALKEKIKGSPFLLGAQDCHPSPQGAHTGDISAPMLKDVGADYVLLGHSERRRDHYETDELICEKAIAAQNSNLVPIVCIGETKEERAAKDHKFVMGIQIKGSLPQDFNGFVAYEPIWAIGTGVSAQKHEIAEIIEFIREELMEQFGERGKKIPILYGGSVKPSNIREILEIEELGGVLVGSVSIMPKDFLQLLEIAHDFIST